MTATGVMDASASLRRRANQIAGTETKRPTVQPATTSEPEWVSSANREIPTMKARAKLRQTAEKRNLADCLDVKSTVNVGSTAVDSIE